MRIRMVTGISGGRADGRAWPSAGHEIDVPDHEGADLIRARHAIYVGPAEPPPQPAEVQVVSESSPTGAGPEPEEPAAEESGIPDEETGEIPEPKPSDPKQSWIDYAMSRGATEDEANGMTKADLMSRHGGRL